MNDSGFVDHCLELLSPLGATRSHRMFGGHALYVDDLCIALVMNDALYLKVDDASRAAFVAARCRPFVYTAKNDEIHSLGYYTAPEEAMESPAEMIPWARRALTAAVAARAKAPPKKKAAAKQAAVKKVAAKTPTPKKAVTRKTFGTPAEATRAPAAVAKPTPKASVATKPKAAKGATKPAVAKPRAMARARSTKP